MKTRNTLFSILAILAVVCISEVFAAEGVQPRETVLDRVVHVEKDLAQEVPEVSRLCDTLKMPHEQVDIGGCKLYCEQQGEGMPLVLLHGGPGATHHVFHPDFGRAAEFCRVIYYDQRGCGLSEYERGSEYSIDQAVDDLDALRKALGVTKWVVLGHSYGGLLAQCYAVKYPENVAGLVLVCASPAAPLELEPSRQGDYLSNEERQAISTILQNGNLTLEQLVFNAHLNGDWKRQDFYKPSREQLARTARYEWHHHREYRNRIAGQLDSIDLSGAFDGCSLPILIMEAKWDLTWNTDKPEKFHASLPGSELVVLENSGHSPFADEPEVFFSTLRKFVETLPTIPDEKTAQWKQHLTEWQANREADPKYILQKADWGRAWNERLAKAYSAQWLDGIDASSTLLKLGFALYDGGRYEDALVVFQKMAEARKDDPHMLAVAMIWEGHMLDLLGKRPEAIEVYRKVKEMKAEGEIRHDQFGLSYSPSAYAATRIAEPFKRLENREP